VTQSDDQAATPSAETDSRSARRQAIRRALETGDQAAATTLATEALAAGDEHPLLLNLRAFDHEAHARWDSAIADLRRAQTLAPRDFAIANALGLCLARQDRMADAVAAFDDAISINPDFAPAHFNRGWALEPLGDLAEARRAYERAIEIEPDHGQALANLATLAARRGAFAEAGELAERALARLPGLPTAETALAAAELGQKNAEAALARLDRLLARPDVGPLDRAVAEGQRGDALDTLGDTVAAFAAYTGSNDILRALYAPRFAAPGEPTVSNMLEWLIDYFKATPPWVWAPRAGAQGADGGGGGGGEAQHVFLLGFVRSGTTLAEQVLAAHPDVVALEERETLHAALSSFLRDRTHLDRLPALDDAALEPYRESYWDVVRRYGVDPRGKVFLDKNPFNTAKLPLIARLFPKAKILFAVRDPRDVVFSAFRRRFGANGSTFEYLTLEGAARAYDLTMSLAELCRPILKFDEHRLVYERLVEDFDGEMRKVCAFIGLDWTPAMADFTGRARGGSVAAITSAQVSRSLYREGMGQWRRYAAQMTPVQHVLEPWVRKLGYQIS
jgi:tetratricopeptide (TPR) repeat protein